MCLPLKAVKIEWLKKNPLLQVLSVTLRILCLLSPMGMEWIMFLALKEKNQKDYLLSKKEIRFLLFIQENWKKQKHSLEL
nr:MAG TPA: hypothetical protein [Caudoviricetes sp.]DAY55205.1 MAG TPA: hypothetical protein [Caudoviricetes sp.]DAZ06254.1 MAG TPA: hypothetical protein [Caudoviricetes sp.]